MPKVIDFGIAKAIDQRLTEKTMFTQYGAIVGTLEYMSPEQAEMSATGRRHPQRHLLARACCSTSCLTGIDAARAGQAAARRAMPRSCGGSARRSRPSRARG